MNEFETLIHNIITITQLELYEGVPKNFCNSVAVDEAYLFFLLHSLKASCSEFSVVGANVVCRRVWS